LLRTPFSALKIYPQFLVQKVYRLWVVDLSIRVTPKGDGSVYFDHRIIDKRIMIAELDKVYAAGGSIAINVNFIENDTILRSKLHYYAAWDLPISYGGWRRTDGTLSGQTDSTMIFLTT
jgi:hypothetical protein